MRNEAEPGPLAVVAVAPRTTLLAAIWAAGQPLMPLAAGGHQGTVFQELVIKVGLVSLSLVMVAGTVLVLWGLRGATEPEEARPAHGPRALEPAAQP